MPVARRWLQHSPDFDMPEADYPCKNVGCSTKPQFPQPFCLECWERVPREIKDRVKRAHNGGSPTRDYKAAIAAARCALKPWPA